MISDATKDNLVTYALIGAIGYLFTSIGDYGHFIDLMSKDIESNKENNIELKQSVIKLWDFTDVRTEQEISNLKIEVNELKNKLDGCKKDH